MEGYSQNEIFSLFIFHERKSWDVSALNTMRGQIITRSWANGRQGNMVQEIQMYILHRFKKSKCRGRRGRDRMVVVITTTYVTVLITTSVVSSNPAQARCTRYNII
jgi:hypothetical protein